MGDPWKDTFDAKLQDGRIVVKTAEHWNFEQWIIALESRLLDLKKGKAEHLALPVIELQYLVNRMNDAALYIYALEQEKEIQKELQGVKSGDTSS